MKLAACLGAALFALLATPAAAEDENGCQMLPREAVTSTYAGYSVSRLCEAGQLPIWNGLPDNTARITRFVFTDGHSSFYRFVTITERPDGSAFAEVGGAETPYRGDHEDLRRRRFALSAERLGEINRLAEESGTFDHAVGTWDQVDGELEIYFHCQLLEMERADADGYRFSSVNIGCNRPSRLMPLVDEVIALAGIERVRQGWAGN